MRYHCVSTGKHCSRIMAELRLPGAIGFAKQEIEDNATKDCGRHRRASKQASPAAHDKIAVRALSGRHGVCETAREGAFEGSLSTALTSINARDENNSSSIWSTIEIRDPLPSRPTTGMVSPPPRQPQWTPKPGINVNPCVPAEAQKNTRFMSSQVEEDPRRPSRKKRRPGSPRARLPSTQPVRVVS